MSDPEARHVLRGAFALEGMPAPSVAELQAAQAIARFEGGYGGGWQGAGAESNNWGAIQCGHRAPCGEGCFPYPDHDAAGNPYIGCFRRYGSAEEGAAALLHQLYRREGVPAAMASGDATQIAERMRASGYFEAPADRYARAIETNAREVATALGEPLQVQRGGGLVRGGSSASSSSAIAGPLLFAGFLWGLSQWKRSAAGSV